MKKNRETKHEDKEWSHLVPDMIQWWAFVNTAVILQIPQRGRNFLTS